MQQGLSLGSRNRTVGEAGSSHSHLPTGSTHLLSDHGTPDLSGHHVPGQRGYSSFSTGFDFTLALKPLLDMLSTNDYAPGLNILIENYSNLKSLPLPCAFAGAGGPKSPSLCLFPQLYFPEQHRTKVLRILQTTEVNK